MQLRWSSYLACILYRSPRQCLTSTYSHSHSLPLASPNNQTTSTVNPPLTYTSMYVHAVSPSDTSAAQYEQATIQSTPMQIYNPTPHPHCSLWLMIRYGSCKTRARIRMLRISAPFLHHFCALSWFGLWVLLVLLLIGLGLGFLLSLPLYGDSVILSTRDRRLTDSVNGQWRMLLFLIHVHDVLCFYGCRGLLYV